MKLYDEGKLDIDMPISHYLSELDTTNKKDLLVRDIMAHHAGLKGWIPFYRSTLDGDKQSYPSETYYRNSYSDSFSIEVAEDLFLRSDYKDTIWHKIITSPLGDNAKYVYSDLGFYLMAEVVQRLSGMSIDEFADLHFYGPLGLSNTCFNPSFCHAPDEIVPSENDEYFRNQILKGHVHDMGAAMLGGVSGHAGLFSNARELAVIMQMLLNDGEYGGIRILKAETVHTFTKPFVRSTRRAIGFDGKEKDPNRTLNMAAEASEFTFGHMGFTGACAWADPKNDIVYIFLSNRTFPSMDNKKFIYNNYRPRVQQVIYQSMH
jgi:CubicO group peptidase (beta-lactamase class C family)